MWTIFKPIHWMATNVWFNSPHRKLLLAGISYVHWHATHSRNPCFDGICSVQQANFMLTMNGPPEAIGDLTEAGGWQNVDVGKCRDDYSKLYKMIYVTCIDERLCENLEDNGAVGKVVRVPFECSESGFAMLRDIMKNDDDTPYRMVLDPKFTSKPIKPHKVDFAFSAISNGDEDGNKLERRFARASSDWAPNPEEYAKNNNFDWVIFDKHHQTHLNQSIKDHTVLEWDTACKPTEKGAKNPQSRRWIEAGKQQLGRRAFNKPSVESSLEGKFSMKASVGLDVHVALGLTIMGSVIPRIVKDVRAYGHINGKFEGNIKIAGSAKGELKTEDIRLVNIPIAAHLWPQFPGIFTVGPHFQVFIRPEAKVEATLEQEIGFGYKFQDLRMFFPEGEGKNITSGSLAPLETTQSLKLGDGKVTLEAGFHVIPRLSFGLYILDEATDVYLETDIAGVAGLSLERSQNIGKKPSLKRDGSFNTIAKRDKNFLTRAGLRGCAYANISAAINMGANLDFLKKIKVVDTAPKQTLFEKNYEIFKKCTDDAQGEEQGFGKYDYDQSGESGGQWRRSLSWASKSQKAKRSKAEGKDNDKAWKCQVTNNKPLEAIFSMVGTTSKKTSQ